jgi:hypothetical protein
VLRSALELLEGHEGPVVLSDFPDDAPDSADSDDEQSSWACPIVFHPKPDHRPDWVRDTLDEMERLAPWREVYVERRGAAAPAVSGLERERLVDLLGEFAGGATDPAVESERDTHEWLRLGCDDLRTWYMEAAQGQPGRGSSSELSDWFWYDTALARLIGLAAGALLDHPDPMLRGLASRALVPRQYFQDLVHSIDLSDRENGGKKR